MAVRELAGRHWDLAPVGPNDFTDPGRPVPVSIVGAHGGSGTTTVARLIGAADLGQRWPHPGDGHPPRLLVVARTNADGLAAVSGLLGRHRASTYPAGTYLAGFVLVRDAPGKLPRILARRVKVLASAAMVYQVPWVETWRLCGVASDPGEAVRIGDRLRRFAAQAAMAVTPSLSPITGGFSCK